MKVLINNQEKDLIPYKGNPQQWWDGKDEDKIYAFGELKFPTVIQNVTQTAAKITVKTSVSGSITKVYKNKKKSSS